MVCMVLKISERVDEEVEDQDLRREGRLNRSRHADEEFTNRWKRGGEISF